MQDQSFPKKKSRILTIAPVGLPMFIMLVIAVIFPSGIADDAYITLRYARNIAQGYGFVWNIGEAPIWGSTSFLWTIIVGTLGSIGFELTQTAQIVSIILGEMSIIVLYLFGKYVLNASTASVVLASTLLSTSTISGHVLTGFDTMLFVLLSQLVFVLTFLGSMNDHNSKTVYVGLTIVGFALIMARPEGCIIAVASAIILLLNRCHRNWKSVLKLTLTPIIVLFIVYCGFLELYFGSWLPNTFSMKATTLAIRPWSVFLSLIFLANGVSVLAIVLCGNWLLRRKGEEKIRYLLILSPWVLYYLAYWSINQIQNVLMRFEFPILPILLMLLPAGLDQTFKSDWHLITEFRGIRSFNIDQIISILIVLGLSVGLIGFQLSATLDQVPYQENDDKAVVGAFLSKYQSNGYLMLVTEAGMLPYFSKWRVLDAGGLNDVFIAQNGFSIDYVTQAHPHIVQFHEYYSEDDSRWRNSTESWEIMTYSLRRYCLENNYTLACIVRYEIQMGFDRSQEGYQWYFVRPDFAHSDDIVIGLSSLAELNYEYKFNATITHIA